MPKIQSQSNTFGVSGTRKDNHASKLVFASGAGKFMVVTYDRATTSNNIYVHEVDTLAGTSSLRAQVAAPFVFGQVVAAKFPTLGDLAIVIVETPTSSSNDEVRYCKFNYTTNTFSAWEDVSVNGTAFILGIDVAVDEVSNVLIAFNDGKKDFFSSKFNEVGLRMKRASDGAWFSWTLSQDNSSTSNGGSGIGGARCNAIAIASLGGNTRVGWRDYVVYWGRGYFDDGDFGISGKVFRIDYGVTSMQSANVDVNMMVGEATPGGDTWSTGTYQQLGERVIRIYNIRASRYAVAVSHGGVNFKLGVLVREFNNSSGGDLTTTLKMPMQTSVMPQGAGSLNAISFYYEDNGANERAKTGWGTLTFAGFKNPGNSNLVIKSVVFRFLNSNHTSGEFSSGHEHGIPSGFTSLYSIHSMGDRFLSSSKNPILVESFSAFNTTSINSWEMMYADLSVATQPIKSTNPADGSVVPTANPTVSASVDLDLNNGQSRYKVHVQFAKNTGFTTSLVDWYPSNADWIAIAGTLSGPAVNWSSTLPNTFSLTNGTWYMRARLMDEYGTFGQWVTTRTLTVGHPPQAGPPFSPENAVEWTDIGGGNGTIWFDWEFTDTSATDSQTALQVRVYNAATNALVHESGKVVSTDTRYQLTISSSMKDIEYYFQVKLWDTDDVAGTFSAPVHFIVTDPPIVTVDSPTSGSVLATGVPTISGNINVSGGRDVKEYTVSITQGGVPIWSKRVIGPFPDGYVFSEKVPQGYLEDGQSYTLQVSGTEVGGLTSTSGLIPFSVDWIPPDGPDDITADLSHYNTDSEGYVLVEWGDESREAPNFVGWNVYRKSDLLNTDSGVVVSEGEIVLIHEERAIGTSYQHQDYFAPSGYKSTYYVTQVVNRDGQDIESDKLFFVETVPQSDGYWLLAPSDFEGEDEAFKLSNVTGDDFTHEREESEIIVIGVGRTFQKGQDLGVKGTLAAQLRHTNGTTARQKKLKIEELTKSGARLWLRNPFGDTYAVNVSGVSISRVAGVGVAEFCDISIPYAQVGR